MRIALLQSCSGIDPAANAAAVADAVARAAAGGAEMLFTPEMSGVLDRDRARAAAAIVGEDTDPTLAAARDAAARAGIPVHLGSLALRGGEGGRFVNRGFLIGSDGGIMARYDKIHLFDVDMGAGERWRESAVYAPGNVAVTTDLPWGRMGLTICYDLRFADLFARLTDAGAVLLSVPSAFTVPSGTAHWHVLLRARAIEAGVFVVAAAQSGRHADGRETYGHSLVVDPWGTVLLDMDGDVGLGFVDIDLEQVEAVRGRIPAIRHRRPIGMMA